MRQNKDNLISIACYTGEGQLVAQYLLRMKKVR